MPPAWWFVLLVGLLNHQPSIAEDVGAVQATVPWAPQAVKGSDGRIHLAYELRLTNPHADTGPVRLRHVAVLAEPGGAPLAKFDRAGVTGLLARPADASEQHTGLSIEAGKSLVLLLWVDVPDPERPPTRLEHRLELETREGQSTTVVASKVPVNPTPVPIFGPPLRGMRWLVAEGPGNRMSHHWGSLVPANGLVTIPQRFAIDFFGLSPKGSAVRSARSELAKSSNADWAGFGAEVLAVADGIVRDAHDGERDARPLKPLPEPRALTPRGLYGNYVILEVAPGVFVHYAHLKNGSLKVHVGQRVLRGAVLGRLGHTGNAGAAHLHFHVSNSPTFEESEGLPYVFDAFDLLGSAKVEETLDKRANIRWPAAQSKSREMPLDGDVVLFGDRGTRDRAR